NHFDFDATNILAASHGIRFRPENGKVLHIVKAAYAGPLAEFAIDEAGPGQHGLGLTLLADRAPHRQMFLALCHHFFTSFTCQPLTLRSSSWNWRGWCIARSVASVSPSTGCQCGQL